jgi:hypothetical protein
MIQLARGAIRAHGLLKEVVFLQANKYSLLVFSDGTVLPTSFAARGDTRWTAIAHEVNAYKYLEEVANQLGGTDPLSLLAFGYSGTGSQCFSTFLSTAGFKSTNVEKISTPLKLRADGSQVHGTKQGELIEWEDGSENASPAYIGTQKKASAPQTQSTTQKPASATPTTKKKWWEFWK